MSSQTDPELGLAEAYLDLGDLFEYWSRQADDEPNPILRAEMDGIAADAMAIANSARADTDAIL